MSFINNKNKRAVSIAGLLLCAFYLLFIGYIESYISSSDWEWIGGNRDHYYGDYRTTPDIFATLLCSIIALPYALPWILYFWRIRKETIDFKPIKSDEPFTSVLYVYLTLFVIITHFIGYLSPYYEFVFVEENVGPGQYYVDLEWYSWRLFALLGNFIGMIIYIPVSIRIWWKNRKYVERESDNKTN